MVVLCNSNGGIGACFVLNFGYMQELKMSDELNLPEFVITQKEFNADNDLIYHLEPVKKVWVCPSCGSVSTHVHRAQTRLVHDLPIQNHRVGLIIKAPRRRCYDCKATFAEEFDSIDKNARMTKRLKEQVRQDTIRKTFSDIADTYGLNIMTVERIFKAYAAELDAAYKLTAPQVLGIDEIHMRRQYRGVFVDILGQRVIEMKEKRSRNVVIDVINSFPNKGDITCVTMDMWDPYREAVHAALPGIPIVVDRFHVIKELNHELETMRRRLRAEAEVKKVRIKLKNARYMLLTDGEQLSEKQQGVLEKLLADYPEFEAPYLLKEAFRAIYEDTSLQQAEEDYIKWLQTYADTGLHCYDTFVQMIANWHTEIFAFFDKRYTNAETESLNNTIRDVYKQGRGYTFEALRIKMIHRGLIQRKGPLKFNTQEDDSTDSQEIIETAGK